MMRRKRKQQPTALEATRLLDPFACPYCKANGCELCQTPEGKIILHADPPCKRFLEVEPATFIKDARLAADALVDCYCKSLRVPQPGWGCCRCRVFNGKDNIMCGSCDHRPRPHPYGLLIN
jgi:hypothetical protein